VCDGPWDCCPLWPTRTRNTLSLPQPTGRSLSLSHSTQQASAPRIATHTERVAHTLSFSNRDSFGCSVPLPLGSRTVDPDSTTVWSGNLLHSSPQPHTAGYVLLFTQWSTRYCNQDLLRRALHTGTAPEWYCSLHAPLHAIALLRSLLPNHPQWRWTMRQSQLH